MKQLAFLALLITSVLNKTAAQQNWAAVPCFQLKSGDGIGRMFVDSTHNEIVLNSSWSYEICNTTYKGIFAFNGHTFHDLDVGINTHDPNPYLGSIVLNALAEYDNKTLFAGGIKSVGSNTLNSRSIAVWNGAVWDTFPVHLWDNALTANTVGGVIKFLNYENKLWLLGGFNRIGNTVTQNITAFDGHTFTPIPSIPVDNPSSITEAIIYKNKLVVSGNFYNSSSSDFSMLAQFDGTSWSKLGSGILGAFSGAGDLAIYKDTLYIAGNFPQAAGNAGNYLMKWDGTQLLDGNFGSFCGYGTIYKLLPYRGRLYAFGTFLCAAEQKAFGVAYYENGRWTVPQDSIDMTVSDAVVYNDAIYISGYFNSINGDSTISKFAKLVCPDFDASRGCISGLKENSRKLSLKVFPNPSNDKVIIELEQSAGLDKLSIKNTMGVQVYVLSKPSFRQKIDVSGLAPGVYFLIAESRQGNEVFKLIKE